MSAAAAADPRPLSWVVGAGGLLGSHTVRALARHGPVWRPERPVPWSSPDAADRLAEDAERFLRAAAGRPWQVAWCAGAGVQSSADAALAGERRLLAGVLDALGDALPGAGPGALFLASSVGGVHGGSADPPFSEHTPPRPTSPYGETKLALEALAAGFCARHGVPAVIGRIANLYGTGQNLAKPQGLVSHLCRAQLLRRPITIYVPLDTVRDYLLAADCGALVAAALRRCRAEAARTGPGVHVKLLASGQGTTVGALIAELRRISRRPLQVCYAASPAARWQARDLRVRSVVWPDLAPRPPAPLAVGMAEVVRDLSLRHQRGLL